MADAMDSTREALNRRKQKMRDDQPDMSKPDAQGGEYAKKMQSGFNKAPAWAVGVGKAINSVFGTNEAKASQD